jgi:uncharacterized protein (TIGR02246 family)
MSQPKRIIVTTFLIVLVVLAILELQLPVKTEASDSDMAAIEKLHQQDIAATLSRDPKALTELWTDDGVLLEPGAQAKIGKQLIGAEVAKEIAAHPEVKVLSYEPEFKELKVMDGLAYEWGYFNSSFKESANSQAKSFRGKMVRIMRKQSNGSWKFARVMWNLAE